MFYCLASHGNCVVWGYFFAESSMLFCVRLLCCVFSGGHMEEETVMSLEERFGYMCAAELI